MVLTEAHRILSVTPTFQNALPLNIEIYQSNHVKITNYSNSHSKVMLDTRRNTCHELELLADKTRTKRRENSPSRKRLGIDQPE